MPVKTLKELQSEVKRWKSNISVSYVLVRKVTAASSSSAHIRCFQLIIYSLSLFPFTLFTLFLLVRQLFHLSQEETVFECRKLNILIENRRMKKHGQIDGRAENDLLSLDFFSVKEKEKKHILSKQHR